MTAFEFEYALKIYKTGSDRGTCYSCGYPRQYTRYLNKITGELLPEKYGRCNRRDSCGYHLNPYTDGYMTDREGSSTPVVALPKKPNIIVDLPSDLLIDSLPWSTGNTLFAYFKRLFPNNLIHELFDKYLVGNHDVWEGSVIFWYVNKDGAIRAGQVKQFDSTGHTVKLTDKDCRIRPRTIWIHNLLDKNIEWMQAYKDQDLRQDCLFGEHLLMNDKHKPIAMFESPKTAIMAAAYFPDYICLAFGSLDNFTFDRAKVLKGRKVILYPDLSRTGSSFKNWSEKAERFKSITDFKVSSILEDNATVEEREKGLDMADFLERFDYKLMMSEIATPPKENLIELPEIKDAAPIRELPVIERVKGVKKEVETDFEFQSILTDLDNGAPWQLIKSRGEWGNFESEDQLRSKFNIHISQHLSALSLEEKQEFLEQRRKAGFTQAGIESTFPQLKYI